jgi:outer membrane protein assembly factor BamB
MAIASRSKDKEFPPKSANYTAAVGWYSSARLKNRALLAFLATVGAVSCAHRPIPPPALFPTRSAWTAGVEDGVDLPPATDGTRLFVATRSGGVLAFNLLDGTLAWGSNRGAKSVSAAPNILVATTADGVVLGLDPETGNVRWRVAGPGSPQPAVIDGTTVVVAGEGVVAIDATAGRPLWEAGERSPVTVPPTLDASMVLSAEADGTLRGRDRTTGVSRWTFASGAPLLASAAVDSRPRFLVGTAARAFVALDAKDGKVAWRWKLGADVRQPPVVYQRSVLFASHEGVLYALNRASGHLDWRAALPARPLSGPLVYKTAVLVACFENQVVGFDARSGRPLGVLRTKEPIRTAPILVGDQLFIVHRDRSIAAHALNLTPAAPQPIADKTPKGRASQGAPRP